MPGRALIFLLSCTWQIFFRLVKPLKMKRGTTRERGREMRKGRRKQCAKSDGRVSSLIGNEKEPGKKAASLLEDEEKQGRTEDLILQFAHSTFQIR